MNWFVLALYAGVAVNAATEGSWGWATFAGVIAILAIYDIARGDE